MKFNISEDDYIAASQLSCNFKLPVILTVLGCLSFLSLIFVFNVLPSAKDEIVWGTLAVLALLPLFIYVIYPRMWRKNYRSYKALQAPLEINFDQNSIDFTNEYGSTKLIFSNIYGWRENEKYILIYHAKNVFSVVPKTIPDDKFDIQGLKHLLQSKFRKQI
jgi:YcxB-like protein